MFGLTRIDAALIISIASAAVASLALLWQVALYQLTGPRLAIRLRPAVLDISDIMVTGPETGWPASTDEEIPYVDRLLRWQVDLAAIDVANIGRSAVSVSGVGFDLGAQSWWRPGNRRSLQMMPYAVHGATPDRTFRLEAGDSALVLMEYWSAAKDLVGTRGQCTLRATATPAGRPSRRSSWRRRLRVDPANEFRTKPGINERELRAYRAFWRAMATTTDAFELTASTWHIVRQALEGGHDLIEIYKSLGPLGEIEHEGKMLAAVAAASAAYREPQDAAVPAD